MAIHDSKVHVCCLLLSVCFRCIRPELIDSQFLIFTLETYDRIKVMNVRVMPDVPTLKSGYL